jgi:diacylglycerol kinase family enzyme
VTERRRTALLVVNPAARATDHGRADRVAAVLEERLALERVETKARGHAMELAASAAEDNLDLVVVLGGDGTLNEVANALAGTATSVAVLPGGEANVFARSLGLPRDPVAAARIVAAKADSPHRVPLGRAGDRWFTANCGVGFDGAIVRAVEAHPEAKRRLGDAFFVWTAMRVFAAGFDRRTPRLSVSWGPGGDERVDHAYLAIVQNLSPFTYLGRRAMRLTPDADLALNLDALVVDSMRLGTMLPVVLSTFARARHGRNRHARIVHDVPWVEVRSGVPMPLQADGEYLGEHAAVRIECVRDALGLVG